MARDRAGGTLEGVAEGEQAFVGEGGTRIDRDGAASRPDLEDGEARPVLESQTGQRRGHDLECQLTDAEGRPVHVRSIRIIGGPDYVWHAEP